MKYTITVQPFGRQLEAEPGENLLQVLRRGEAAPEAPCGGHGTCGKCQVDIIEGRERRRVSACQTAVNGDMRVYLPETEKKKTNILSGGCEGALVINPATEGYLLAFDIGTTTVVGYLLDGKNGQELSCASMLNPQAPFGADVISRIQCARQGEREAMTGAVREGMEELIRRVCKEAGIQASEIGVVSVVANPCMQQLFMGLEVDNLAAVPFSPVLTRAEERPAAEYLPSCTGAKLLVVPDISGYVGADTLGCVLASAMDQAEDRVLLVDIGTNGEMVLTDGRRMTACSTAAGPALEGAKILFGMRGAPGAIDHVSWEEGALKVHVMGEAAAEGICGSGLIDAVAVMKRAGIINKRGRIQTGESLPEFGDRLDEVEGERIFRLTDQVYLTQQDIREVQMAKGAIAAGIELMAGCLGLKTEEIDRVLLAGAFGSFMDSDSACEIGLLPESLRERITVIGNAAGSGAKMLACNREELDHTRELTEKIEFIELASLPEFQRCFGRNMNFTE